MDDGSLQNKGLHLSTYSFTHDDVLLLQNTLINLFYLISLLNVLFIDIKKATGYTYHLWGREESMHLVRGRIMKYMHFPQGRDMIYKIKPL